jgi:FAD/FMN-containing dehydrogenase
MFGNNGAGEKTLTHGKIEDYVLETKHIFSDGKEYDVKPLNKAELDIKMRQTDFEGDLYRKVFQLIDTHYDSIKAAKPNVSKNSAGYFLWNVWDRETGIFNLNKLLVGSQGSLGIMTQVKFKLVKPTTHSKLLVMFLKDLTHLADIVEAVLKYKPETFESYDDQTLKLAVRFLPELIKTMKPRSLMKLGIQFLPEAWMALTGGFPKLVLMAEFANDEEAAIDGIMEAANRDLQKFNIQTRVIKDESEAEKYWTIRHESFNLLRHHVHGRRTAAFIDDIVVRPEHLPEFLPQLNKILEKYDLIYTIAGHVGDGNFHIIPLMDFSKPETHQIIPELSKKVYDLVLSYHGSITAEHNDGLIRSPFLEQMYGKDIYSLFRQTKQIFDPQNIFNPGKKVGSSMEYAMQHLVKNS